MEIEYRSTVLPFEFRDDQSQHSAGVKVSGYAAVFGEQTNVAGMFIEVIESGAFSRAIGSSDVPFLINHEGLPLARSVNGVGTLKLSEDAKGLMIESDLDPEDPDVKSIVPKMRRGDLGKMSFAFRPVRQMWEDPQEAGGLPLRRIMDVDLYDVSIVTTPQYHGTEIALRFLNEYKAEQRTTPACQAFRVKKLLNSAIAMRIPQAPQPQET